MYKKGSYIAARIAGLVVVLVVACLIAVQVPQVQTRLSQRILSRLTESAVNGKIAYDELQINPSGVLILRNVSITDNDPTAPPEGTGFSQADTLFHAEAISATFSVVGLLQKKGIKIGRLHIKNACFHLVTEPEGKQTNLEKIFGLERKGRRPEVGGDVFEVRKAVVENLHFVFNNHKKALPSSEGESQEAEKWVDFTDIDLTARLRAHSIKYTGSRLYASVDDFSLREKSGYAVSHLSGSCAVGQGLTVVEDLSLVDAEGSKVSLDRFDMSYDKPLVRSKFVDEVGLRVGTLSSSLSLRSLRLLLGEFIPKSSESVSLSAKDVEGTVNSFSVGKLGLKARDERVRLSVAGRVDNITTPPQMALDVAVEECGFNTADAAYFLDLWGVNGGEKIKTIAPGETLSLTAEAKGSAASSLSLDGELSTAKSGKAAFSSNIKTPFADSPKASVELSSEELRLDTFTGNPSLGVCSLFALADVELSGGELKSLSLDSLNVSRLRAFGYTYSDITCKGVYDSGTAELSLLGEDPNLDVDIKALADIIPTKDGQRFSILGELNNVDLYALGIDRRRSVSRVAGGINGGFVVRDSTLDGELLIDSLSLENPDGVKQIGDILVQADGDTPIRYYSLKAPFAEFAFSGSSSVSDFVAILSDATLRRDLPSLFSEERTPLKGEKYNVDLLLHDSRDLLSFVCPGLYIAEESSLHLTVDEDGYVKGAGSVPRVAFGKNYLKNAVLLLDNLGNSLNLSVNGVELSAGNFEVTNPAVELTGADDRVSFSATFDSYSGAGGAGDISVDAILSRNEENKLVVDARPLESFVTVGDDTWRLGRSEITLCGGEVSVRDFDISSGSQSLSLNGAYGAPERDSLCLSLKDIDLSVADKFLPREYGLKGVVDGEAVLTSENGSMTQLSADLSLNSLGAGEASMGNLRLSAYLEDGRDDVAIYVRNEYEGRTSLDVNASYFLDDGRMSVAAVLDKFPVAMAKTFLKDIFSDIGGDVSGKISLQGQAGYLSSASEGLRINNILLKPSYTGVSYTVNGPFRVDEKGVYFDSVDIRDDSGGTGTLSGVLHHDHLNDFNLDSHLEVLSLKAIDAAAAKESGVYGLLKVSGRADISGPFEALNINADIATTGDGNIHIPTNGTAFGGSSGLLTFAEEETPTDPYEEMLLGLSSSEKELRSDMNIRARVTAHPGVSAFVEIDKSSGNMLSFNGEGAVSLHLRPSKSVFDVNGSYNISEGNYRFVVPGIFSKDFEIQNGSSIKFGGDILNSELDLNAIYSLHTSLNAIVTDSSSIATRRLVECGIGISGGLRDPQIAFSVNVPDLDPNTKVQVDNALNTDDKMQKQFLALLLIGSFIPDENSGVVNNSNIVLSNVTEVVSSQFNSILQRLEIPLDVGVSYLGSYQGTNIFDVAISTRLFNNRVLVSGTVGNRRGLTVSSSNGDMVGDVDVEIKMDPEGQYRFSIFSHSADQYTSYLDYSQRNGVGISFQKEYRTFSEMMGKLFRPKAYGSVLPAAQRDSTQRREVRIIKIENGK